MNFIRAYATLIAHPVPLTTISARLRSDGIEVGPAYPSLFHDFASRLFVVEEQPSWSPARRSRTRLVANPKRHFVDPSLAAAALDLDPEGLLADFQTFGFLFESLVVRDLRVYAQSIGAKVWHYRTKDATSEMDAVVEFRDGRWLGVEVKLGYSRAEAAAHRLAEVAASIERPATALVVVVPDGPVLQLPNGVWIAPLGALGP